MANVHRKIDRNRKIIGLVPAAGQATRLSPLPFSKELYPIGHMRFKGSDDLRPKAVCIYLLEKMKIAGIKDIYIILRKGKWDIPAYLGDGSILGMNFAYLMMNLPFGVPYTLNQAFPFTQDAIVAFGFPDIIFQTDDAFVSLLTKQAESNADVVLGTFSVSQPEKWDMVKLEPDGRVCEIQIKPKRSSLKYTWIIAVWTPTFTRFLYDYVSNALATFSKKVGQEELSLSFVLEKAVKNDMHVQSQIFKHAKCIDIGTSTDLEIAIKDHNYYSKSK